MSGHQLQSGRWSLDGDRLSRGLEGPGWVQVSWGWCSEGRGAGEGSTRKPLPHLLSLNPEALLPVLITFSSQTRLLWTCPTRESWEPMTHD